MIRDRLYIILLVLLGGNVFGQTGPLDIGDDVIQCPGECVDLFSNIFEGTFLWSTGDTTDALTICPTTSTEVTLTVIDTGGQSFSDTMFIEVLVCNDSVYPGDANADGIADVYDVLSIGQAFGFTGPARPDSSTNWVGQFAPNWAGGSAVLNYKHADSDGNGVIQLPDFEAVDLNYGLTHNKNLQPYKRLSGRPPIYIDIPEDTLFEGDTINFIIRMGDTIDSLHSIYGVGINWLYNGSLIDTTKGISYDYSNCILGTPGTDLYTLEKNFFAISQLDIGATRLDQLNVSGNGELVTVSMILIDDIAGKDDEELVLFKTYFTDIFAQLDDGTEILMDAFGDSVYIKMRPVSVKEPPRYFETTIYPNPASGHLNIELPVDLPGPVMLEVYNITGTPVLINEPLSGGRQSIPVDDWAPGIYMLELRTDDYRINRKVIIH